jgi:hypothetical protein
VLKVIGDWMPSGLNGLAVVVGLYLLGLLLRHLSGMLLSIYTRRFHAYKQQFASSLSLSLSSRCHLLIICVSCVNVMSYIQVGHGGEALPPLKISTQQKARSALSRQNRCSTKRAGFGAEKIAPSHLAHLQDF